MYRRLIFDFNFEVQKITRGPLVIHLFIFSSLFLFYFKLILTVLAFSSRFTNLNQHEIILMKTLLHLCYCFRMLSIAIFFFFSRNETITKSINNNNNNCLQSS